MSTNKQYTPSFPAAIKLFFDSRLAETLHTCMPGKILKYDSKTRKAEILPLIKKHYSDGTLIEYRPISNVPVTFYGAGESGMRLPSKQFKNQQCILVFSERSLENWLKKGIVTEPGSKRKFDLSDAMAILSINSFAKKDEDIGGDNLEIYFKGSIIRIKENGNIEIGIDAFKKLLTESVKDIFNNHVHNFVGDMGATLSTSPPASLTPTLFSPPGTGGAVTLFGLQIADSDLTSIVKAE